MRVGRCAPGPHLGALRTVEGPIMFLDMCGQGGPERGVQDKPDSTPLGCGEVSDEVAYS